jgi:tetratricopeptide (TPR) repeat protein
VAIQASPQLAIFMDLRQKQVTVPALQPGDTIVFKAVWTLTKPLIPNHFWFSYSFTKDAVVNVERLEIDAPATGAHFLRVAKGSPAEAGGGAGSQRGDRRIYRWQTSNAVLPAEDAPEPDEPPVDDVRLTTFRDWDELGRWFNARLNVAPDAAIRAKAAELTKGASDRNARIQAIYDFVATQIRYVSLSFGIGRLVPHAPADVLKHQYGDCKDKHALMAALLSSAGITAYPVVINSSRDISDDFASPGEVNHVLTVIPSEAEPAAWTYLDTTTEVAPFGMLMPELRAQRALVAGNDGLKSRLITTPSDPPFPFIDRMTIDGTVDAIGVLRANVRFAMRGDRELAARLLARGLPKESTNEFVQRFIEITGLKGDVSHGTITDPAATREPFELIFQLRYRYFDWAAASSTAVPPSPSFGAPGSGEPLSKDLEWGTPTAVHLRSTVDLPDGYDVRVPVGMSVSAGGIDYKSSYEVTGRRVVTDRSLSISARTFLVSSSPELQSVHRRVQADLDQKFTLRRTGTTVPSVPADATASELYGAGYSAYEAKLYEAALLFWRRATEVDPKMADAWNGLAFAYSRLGQHAEAVKALDKQIALNAYDKRAYADLGYVQRQAGNKEAAAHAYARHVELNPLDGAAFHRLGELYLDLKRDGETIAALEKASSLGQKDDWIPIEIGVAHLRLKRRDKAISSFDRALEMSDRPAVWTKVAWELATNDIDRARVMELTARTMKRAAEVMDGLSGDSAPRTTLDLMERLAWSWDARGVVHLNSGETDVAIQYLRAAWQLGGSPDIADHLGQAYEKQNKLADAMALYLMAQALDDDPPQPLRDRVKLLAGGGDLDKMFQTAKSDYVRQRSVTFKHEGILGKAEFLAIVQTGSTPTSLRMLNGDTALRAVEERLRRARLPLEAPGSPPVRLLVKLEVVCVAQGCRATVLPPSRAAKD